MSDDTQKSGKCFNGIIASLKYEINEIYTDHVFKNAVTESYGKHEVFTHGLYGTSFLFYF